MSDIRSFFIRHDGCCARVAVCLSGTGSNADVLLASAGSAGTSFKAVVLFTDAPESSRAVELGRKYNIPVESLDIRKFYAGHGEDDIRLNSDRRRQLRDQWSEKVWEILQKYRCDFAVFAGFMPLTNLAEKLPCLNVHPGDLTVEKDGQRIYAGLHYKPVERAILNGEKYLRSSVILVQSFAGKKDVDAGPILGISAPVAVELLGHLPEELAEAEKSRCGAPVNDILRECAKASVDKLKTAGDHVVLPKVVELFAQGRFGENSSGELCFCKSDGSWESVKTVEFSAAAEPAPLKKDVSEKKIIKRSANKFVRFCKYMYTKIVRANGSPDYIARGWALGMFVGCVVPVFCQLIVAIPLSFVVRGSKIGAALGTFITTPPTAIFIYPVQIWVGNKLINGDLSADSARRLLDVFNSEALSFSEKWQSFVRLGGDLVAAFFAGGLAWALIMTPLTYFGVRYLVVRYRNIRSKMLAKNGK
ncbi:MAG: DUF2062 domain-containing protein [Lentisphaerae bacterium]|nr:DUF2062 domain-containing protein [Lentisphaerota bacterium]